VVKCENKNNNHLNILRPLPSVDKKKTHSNRGDIFHNRVIKGQGNAWGLCIVVQFGWGI